MLFSRDKLPDEATCYRIVNLYQRVGKPICGNIIEYDAKSGRLLLQTEYLDLIEAILTRVEKLEGTD